MSRRGNSKPIPVILVLLTASLSIIILYAAGFGQIGPVYATLPVVVGIDCGLGSTQATLDPITTVPIADGTLDPSCSWVGDVDITAGAPDGIIDPLVSDNPSSVPAGTGGGFTVDVRATGLTQEINGFDVSLSYDTRYLDAVLIDQTGLFFGDPANMPFVLVKSISRSTGIIRMAEVLLAPVGATGDVTLFRVRFDVVGVGSAILNIFDDVLTDPQAVPHKTQSASFESVSFFDPSSTLGWDVSWVFSPNPEVPGSPLTFTATAVCTGCGTLSYSWDTNSNGVADTGEPTGNPATISPPHPIIHRATLTVSDGSNTVMAVRRLPLTVAVEGPSTIAVNAEGMWTGRWLGGIPTYTGPWRFCPGTATATTVCHRPAPTVSATQGQTNTQTLNQLTAPLGAYHFAGVYTNTLRITDSTRIAAPQLGPNDVQVTATFLVEVTGTPQAYTITVSNPAKADSGQSVSFTATMRYATTYPTGFRSSSFNLVFDFGDGATSAASASGCSTTEPPATTCTASASHVYTVAAATSFNVKVTTQETASAAVSRIQEVGTGSIIINPPAVPLVPDFTFDPSNPTAGKPVTLTDATTGGTQPYTLAWDFGDSSPVGSGSPVSHAYAAKGSYSVSLSVTDSAARTASVTKTVVVTPQPLTVTVACPDAGLTAGKPFTCDVSASGGTSPYSGTGLQSVMFPVKGTYTVSFTVTDANAVSATGSDSVVIEAQPLVVTVACPETGLTAGVPFTCDVSASGGTAPYEGTGPREATISAKGVQTVTFTVTDSNGVIASGTDTVTMAPIPLTVDFSFSPTSPTAGEPVIFTANAVGGTIPYSFAWDFGDGNTATINPATHTFASAADYTVQVTVTDINSATATVSHIVTVNPEEVPFEASFTFTPANPTVGKPVSFTSSVSGGTAPYSYRWNFGDFSITDLPNPDHVYAAKGTYTVILIVTDNNNVDARAEVAITVQTQPLVVTVVCPETGLTAGKPFECTVSATGGTTPYVGTGQRTTSLPAKGTHSVTFEVTDNNLVSATGSDTVIIDPQPLVASFTFSPLSPQTGEAVTFTASVTGGTAPYLFSWDFGDGGPDGSVNPASHVYDSQGSFTVILTVTDANGASTTDQRAVSVGGALAADFTFTIPATAGKPVTFTAQPSGGAPLYTFLWDFGDGSLAESGSPVSHAYAVKGSYSVTLTVTDETATSTSTTKLVVVDSQPLVVDFTLASPVTAGKPVTFTSQVSGGSGPYTVHWDVNADGSFDHTGDTFTTSFPVKGTISLRLHVIDSNGGDAEVTKIVTVDPQPMVVTVDCPDTGLTAGKPFTCNVSATGGTAPYSGTGAFTVSYPVKTPLSVSFDVTDANAVTATGSDLVTIDPQPLIVIVNCPDTGLTAGKPFDCEVSATGGTSPYVGTGTFSRSFDASGKYTVTFTVTDANEALADGSDTVQVAPQPPGELVVTVNCPGSGLTAGKPFQCDVSAIGGTPLYTGTGVQTAIFNVKGSYTVSFTVTDSLGNSASGSDTVTIDAQPLTVTVSCPDTGLTAGKPFLCVVSAAGGTTPYFGTGDLTTTLQVKGTTIVNFEVTDSNSVTATGSTTVTIDPQPLTVDFTFIPAIPASGEEVTFIASASGGTSPYTFSWEFGDGTTGVGSGVAHTYSVKGSYDVVLTATDENGASVEVRQVLSVAPQTVLADFAANPSPATAGQPVIFIGTALGGTGPYTFSWDFGDETTGSENPAIHSYSLSGEVIVQLTITDANGATAIASHALSVLPQPVAAAMLTFDGCDVDSFENGVGELSVFINGNLVVNIPAGLHGLTGSGEYAPYDGVCVSFGPFDTTSSIHEGINTLVFQNPLSSHFSQIKNIRVVQGDMVLLFDPRTRSNSPGPPEVLTFSVPPLVLSSFQTNSAAFATEPVAFAATFAGGTAPFKCTFSFGDGDTKSVTTNLHSCSATHTYWSARLRTATVRVRGVALADDVRGSLLVRIEPQPGCAGDDDDDDGDECLSWNRVIDDGEQQTFTAQLTNPASVPVLIRLDFTITRPDGSKETFISPSFALNPGQTLSGLSFNYAPSGGLGKYCFKAPLKYGTDVNNNGVLEDGEILGKRTAKSGCFEVVDPAFLAISPFLFFGTALLPKARNKIGRYFEKKNSTKA